MPELPEVEVLVRHLAPLLQGRRIAGVVVHRERVVRPHRAHEVPPALEGAVIAGVARRAKFLVFDLRPRQPGLPTRLIGHLGMTGRMFLQPKGREVPRHAAVTFDLGPDRFIFEDTRYFGRLTWDDRCLARLGPEPLGDDLADEAFARALGRSRAPIKVRLLDQSVLAGIGNIYASEALHRAAVSPRRATCRISTAERTRLLRALRDVLEEAIRFGSTLPLDFAGTGARDGLFYYGRVGVGPTEPMMLAEDSTPPDSMSGHPAHPEVGNGYYERLRVYDRDGEPCLTCSRPIRRIIQAARSTFFCPNCQK